MYKSQSGERAREKNTILIKLNVPNRKQNRNRTVCNLSFCLFIYVRLSNLTLSSCFSKNHNAELELLISLCAFFHWICLHMTLFSNYKPQVPYRISFSFCLSRIIWTWSIFASKKKTTPEFMFVYLFVVVVFTNEIFTFSGLSAANNLWSSDSWLDSLLKIVNLY